MFLLCLALVFFKSRSKWHLLSARLRSDFAISTESTVLKEVFNVSYPALLYFLGYCASFSVHDWMPAFCMLLLVCMYSDTSKCIRKWMQSATLSIVNRLCFPMEYTHIVARSRLQKKRLLFIPFVLHNSLLFSKYQSAVASRFVCECVSSFLSILPEFGFCVHFVFSFGFKQMNTQLLFCLVLICILKLGKSQTCSCIGCTNTASISASGAHTLQSGYCSSGQVVVINTLNIQSNDGSLFDVMTQDTASSTSYYPSLSGTSLPCIDDVISFALDTSTYAVMIKCDNLFENCPLTHSISATCQTSTTPSCTSAPPTMTGISDTSSCVGTNVGSSCSLQCSAGYTGTYTCLCLSNPNSWDCSGSC